VDASGAAYVVGWTQSSNFPTTPGAFQPFFAGWADAFVTQLNTVGSELLYSTYLGGNSDDGGWYDRGPGIAVDMDGTAYIGGYTTSLNFPITPGAFQTTCLVGYVGCSDAFVAWLSADGSELLYSTYLGRTNGDLGVGIAVGVSGIAYVLGYTGSNDFPITPGAYDPIYSGVDVFVTKMELVLNPLTPTPTSALYQIYLPLILHSY
jgi:hypothetical protein